jgi:hypothetical protein
MIKILIAFIIFAVISVTLLLKMGDKVDMQGETHGVPTETSTKETTPATATEAAPATPAASDAPATPAPEKK